ncbi:MIZ zinc finger protein (macronuclear) [Tetrahymena thermophila SB210]|uniref:MIZ zinc finger protein n=1 Tax=Tetrahymena thermophila (strain SB210) TaxID=312017 RepID=Q23BQ9_TETTS|nr:MIZ zinc finger protein [Tetrahymena thermophila SB210]EAR94059.1 MIZ zinc finger protein [Tetrahymena thermophila SB210]|eukprot:XP_001014304.1 MIZ zinc finger protein [Tetrahymena thermophila SB210]
MKKLALLIGNEQDESSPTGQNLKNSDCFICKNDQDMYMKALEKKKVINCIICNKLQHPICYNIQNQTDSITNNFACIPCRILYNQPQIQKFENINGPFIVFPKEKQQGTIHFILEEMHSLQLERNQFNDLCVYCMKLDLMDNMNKPLYYIWPSDNIVIKINEEIQSYNLDSLCIVEKGDICYNSKNKFEYNLGDIQQKDQKPIAIGIGIVSNGNMFQVIEKVSLGQTQTEEDMIKQYKEWAKDLEIAIPMKDQITQTLLKWPARGKNCNHFTCIDMYSYLEFNLQNSNLQKSRWACPTCQQRMYIKDIIFDKYLNRFVKEQIINKIDPNHIQFIEEVICDQNGNLRIGDESIQKIQKMQLKKFLVSENKRIECSLEEKKKEFEQNIKLEIQKKLNQPLQANTSLDEDKLTALLEFKQMYPKLGMDELWQIFNNPEQKSQLDFLISLDEQELVIYLMENYPNLRDLSNFSQAEVVYHNQFESILKVLQTNIKQNEEAFYLIYKYSEHNSQQQESIFASIVASIFTIIIFKKNKMEYQKADLITPTFIYLATQFGFYHENVSQCPAGLLIGALFFFYKHIMNFSFQRACNLFCQFVNFNGNENFFLSLQDSTTDFLADTISSFLKMQNCLVDQDNFDSVLFFQKLLLKQLQKLLLDQNSEVSLRQQICLFQTINKAIFRLNPSYNKKPFKEAKEFISKFVNGDKDIIKHIKQYSQIFII